MTGHWVRSVNGDRSRQGALDDFLEARGHDLVFLAAVRHAYSQVKRVLSDLVMVCLKMDDPDSCQLLSMLKSDCCTSGIPVVTLFAEREPEGLGYGFAQALPHAFDRFLASLMH